MFTYFLGDIVNISNDKCNKRITLIAKSGDFYNYFLEIIEKSDKRYTIRCYYGIMG